MNRQLLQNFYNVIGLGNRNYKKVASQGKDMYSNAHEWFNSLSQTKKSNLICVLKQVLQEDPIFNRHIENSAANPLRVDIIIFLSLLNVPIQFFFNKVINTENFKEYYIVDPGTIIKTIEYSENKKSNSKHIRDKINIVFLIYKEKTFSDKGYLIDLHFIKVASRKLGIINGMLEIQYVNIYCKINKDSYGKIDALGELFSGMMLHSSNNNFIRSKRDLSNQIYNKKSQFTVEEWSIVEKAIMNL